MSSIGRVTVKKLAVSFKVNEILDVYDFDVFVCYRDLWKAELEKKNSMRQGIIYSGGCTEECMKFQTNALNKNDQTRNIKLLLMHTETSSLFLLTSKC